MDKSSKMKILLTGGNGFLGKNIQESFLNQKYKIVAPARQELDLADDGSVEKFFRENFFDATIHAAGKPGHRNAPDPTNIFYTDMRMFMNLLQYREQLGKLIVLGSGAIYDQRHSIIKVKEEGYRLRVPADEHALYRRVSAELIEKIDHAVELRIFGIFGKYEDYAIRFISNAICKTLFDLPIIIKQNRKFDYLYVEDLIPVLDYFIEHPAKHKAYNITPDESIELLQMAKKVKAVSDKDLPIKVAQAGLGLEYSGSNLRLKAEIKNWQPTPIVKAIEDLYNWYSEHKSALQKDVLYQDK